MFASLVHLRSVFVSKQKSDYNDIMKLKIFIWLSLTMVIQKHVGADSKDTEENSLLVFKNSETILQIDFDLIAHIFIGVFAFGVYPILLLFALWPWLFYSIW